MSRDKLIEKVAETIYGYDIGNGDFGDFENLASRVIEMVESQLTPLAVDWATVAVCPKCKVDYDTKKKMCISCGTPSH